MKNAENEDLKAEAWELLSSLKDSMEQNDGTHCDDCVVQLKYTTQKHTLCSH